MAATRTMSRSPSPSRRHCNRSAMSRSFKMLVEYITGETSTRDGDAFEEGGETRQVQPLADRRDALGARVSIERGQAGELGERRLRPAAPRRALEPLPRAAPREEVPDHAEHEVVADHVGAGQQDEDRGRRN